MFHINHATKEQVRDVVVRNVSRESALHTDESNLYTALGAEFDAHRTVKHSAGEYVRYEAGAMVTSNTIENVFSVFRRECTASISTAAKPICIATLPEFAFRYNRRSGLGIGDTERTQQLAKGAEGKRLTYRRVDEAANA
jgi:hypothetical protein